MTRLHPTDLENIIEGVAERVIVRLAGACVPAEVDGSTEFRIRQMAREDFARDAGKPARRHRRTA